jgi:hypothetical protein
MSAETVDATAVPPVEEAAPDVKRHSRIVERLLMSLESEGTDSANYDDCDYHDWSQD